MPEHSKAPPIALERYASLHAEMEAGGDIEAVLERESLSKETWLGAQAYWLKRMADEAHRKRFETTNRYQAVFSAKRKVFEARFDRERRRKERPAIAAPPVGVLADASAELAAPLVSQPRKIDFPDPPTFDPVTSRDVPPTAAATPFARPMPSAGAAALGLDAAQRTSPQKDAWQQSERDVPPPPRSFRAGVAPPARVGAAPAERKDDHRLATMSIPLDSIVKPTQSATPFAAGAAKPPAPTAPEPKRDLSSTWSSSDAPPKEAMPFRANPAAATTMPLPHGLSNRIEGPVLETVPMDLPGDVRKQLREQLPLPPPSTRPPNTLATMVVEPEEWAAATPRASALPEKTGRALPFEAAVAKGALDKPKPPPAPPPPVDDDDDMPRTKMVDPEAVALALAKATPFKGNAGAQQASDDDEDASPRTMAFDTTGAPVGKPREALPFGGTPPNTPAPTTSAPAAAPKPKRFSINVFASLTAEIAENPGDAEAIRTRYGLTEAEHHEESMRWTEEFQRSDDTRQRYFGIVQRYRGYIQQRKGPPR